MIEYYKGKDIFSTGYSWNSHTQIALCYLVEISETFIFIFDTTIQILSMEHFISKLYI